MKSLSSAGIAAIEPPVVTLGEADADGWQPFVLRFAVRSGWHLAVEAGLPTLAGAGASLQRIEWPTGRPPGADGPGDPKLPVFEGAVEVRGRLRREAPRATLGLRFVACGEGRCLPPAEVEVPVP
jgi:hypothetical protein